MPIYEYRCQDCEHELEASQKIKDPPLTDCPACGKPRLERLISASAFQLKGGGWGRDLYGTPKSKRTDNDRADRVEKAISEDKAKTDAAKPDAAKPDKDKSKTKAAGSG